MLEVKNIFKNKLFKKIMIGMLIALCLFAEAMWLSVEVKREKK